MIHKDKIQQDFLEQESLETKQRYNNIQMELIALEQLKKDYPTSDKQMERINQLINEFGNKKIDDEKTETDKINTKTGKTIMQTIAGAKNDVLDIMCLAQMMFEDGNEDVYFDIKMSVLKVQKNKPKYPLNLNYLQKCLTNFKPSIYKNLKEHFAKEYGISPDDIQCLPKTTGQQVGAKVVIPDVNNEGKQKTFYVKSHQEFSSKSDPQLGTRTSNGLGFVDLKELFMYKVLEKIGYGPKTNFIIDRDVSQTGVEEGIMIVTQDSGYTKNPLNKEKSFKTFANIKGEFKVNEDIDEDTKKDIITIDMISRVFLLGDVMVNEGNFGRVVSIETNKSKEIMEKECNDQELNLKWKVIDFTAPKVAKGKEYYKDKKYVYDNYYGSGGIVYGFEKGNFSHTYDEDSLNRILQSREDKNLLKSIINNFEKGKSEKKLGIEQAIIDSKEEIMQFLKDNEVVLRLKDSETGEFKEQTSKRISDLEAYCDCSLKNWEDLIEGISKTKESIFRQ